MKQNSTDRLISIQIISKNGLLLNEMKSTRVKVDGITAMVTVVVVLKEFVHLTGPA